MQYHAVGDIVLSKLRRYAVVVAAAVLCCGLISLYLLRKQTFSYV
jgi:hypothetical protein